MSIDDIMLFPVKKEDAAGFFNLINTLHEKASLIITTNKAPTLSLIHIYGIRQLRVPIACLEWAS